MTTLSSGKIKTQADSCRSIFREALSSVVGKHTPADQFLAALFRRHHCYGSRDRRFFSGVLYAFFRYQGWIRKVNGRLQSGSAAQNAENHECASFSVLPADWYLLAASAAEGLSHPANAFFCANVGGNCSPERYEELLRQWHLPAERFAAFVRQTLPDLNLNAGDFRLDELLPAWTLDELPENLRMPATASACEAPDGDGSLFPWLQTRPPVWIRCNSPANAPALLRLFREQEHCDAEAHKLHPESIRLNDPKLNLYAMEAFRKGAFEVQDFSSQCIGFASGASPGERWWDPCAGGGGKTLQLAAMMNGKGSILSSDLRAFKLEDLKQRAMRAGFRNLSLQALDASSSDETEQFREMFDGVLVDAPCSSSGRWRRNPEARFFLTKRMLDELNELQFRILCNAARALKPGAVLIYATCSLFRCENDGICERFLAACPQFRPDAFPNPHAVRQGASASERSLTRLQTVPGDADCDASFVARFRKTSSGN